VTIISFLLMEFEMPKVTFFDLSSCFLPKLLCLLSGWVSGRSQPISNFTVFILHNFSIRHLDHANANDCAIW